MNKIRVNFSGFLAFISGLVSVSFGLVFSLVVVRKLSPESYGTWGLLFSIVSYLLISESIISTWTTRQIARGENIGKSGVLSSLMLSILILPLFIGYAFLISENSETKFEILLLGIILIPVSFVSQTISAINLGHSPHLVSLSQLIFQVVKIPIAIVTVIIFHLDIFGVVLAMFIAFSVKIVFQVYFARDKLKDKFSFKRLKSWIKISWVPLFAQIPNYLTTIDVVLYSIITNSVIGIAYFQVAYSIAAIVQHSGTISQALYPKLLATKSFEGIKKNLNHSLYFAILLIGISIVFSKPALYALNPIYQNGWPIVIALALKIFFQALRTIPSYVISGTEEVDTEHNPKFSKLLKSNLFKMPKFAIIFYSSYMLILVVFLSLFKNSGLSEVEIVTWWAIIGLLIEISYSIFLWSYSRKYTKIIFPIKNLIKYICGMSAFVIFFLLTSDLILNYKPSIYDFLPSLFVELILCVGIYIGITNLIDKETRDLFRSILIEIKLFKL